MRDEPTAQECPRCKAYREERADKFKVYQYQPHADYIESERPLWIDVAAAFEQALTINRLVWNDASDAKFVETVNSHEITEEHLDHVPYSPGLMLTLELHRRSDGEAEFVNILCDGNHRAAMALKKGIPAIYFLLDAQESERFVYNSASEIVAKYAPAQSAQEARGVRVLIVGDDSALVDLLTREGHRPTHYDFREFEAANGLAPGSLGEQEDEER